MSDHTQPPRHPADAIPSRLGQWERAEIERSAGSASQASGLDLRVDDAQIARYLDPPADTPYPLEYSCHLLGDVRGRTVLDYGCSDGLNALVLARRGARVIGVDISAELIRVARRRLAESGVTSGVELVVGSGHALPLADGTVDVVFGVAILHHLDLALAAREVKRVLRPGGRAIFQEPVRNSRALAALRELIPYRSPDASPYERPLTDRDLADFAAGFSSIQSKAFTFPWTHLVKDEWRGGRVVRHCYLLDAAILRRVPALARHASVRVFEVVR